MAEAESQRTTRVIRTSSLTFAIGKVLECLSGNCPGDILDAGDRRGQCSAGNAALELVQRNGILDICGWPEDGFYCLVSEVDDNVRRDGVEATTRDQNRVA